MWIGGGANFQTQKTQQAGTMFRPAGIVVVLRSSNYFEAFLAGLAAGLALADLAGLAAGLAAFLAVVFGAAFFVAISLAPLEKNFGYQFGIHVASLWYPRERNNSKSRHSRKE